MEKLVGEELAEAVAKIFRKNGEKSGPFGNDDIFPVFNEIRLESQAGEETVIFNDDGTIEFVWNFSDDEENPKGNETFKSFKEFLDKVQGEGWGWWTDIDFSEVL